MPIQILSDEIASQIAAGEVVERPASVVKELLENSLDAGASHITISVQGAGKQLIEVADNGSGIAEGELHLSVARHATSKLTSAEDLFHIETLGFRGEALASIGSVSRMMITSRPKDAEMGTALQVDGGHASSIKPIGAPAGTVIRVEDLFFNVPARLKFLKTDRTERRQIDTIVTRYALAYPQVRFLLTHDGRTALQTSGNGKHREVLATIYGIDIAKQMIEVLAHDDHLNVTGFTSSTTLTRSNRREIIFFINGRPVQDIALTTSLVQAYHTMLMVGRYPMAVLFLKIPPEMVDVNVHPTKAEVRFRNRDQVFRGVGRSVRRALLAHTPIPEVDRLSNQLHWSPTWGPKRTSPEIDPAWGMGDGNNDAEEQSVEQRGGSLKVDPRSADGSQSSLPEERIPLLRLVGQVGLAYIIAEGPDGLYLIDQHAAHERVLFERLMAQRQDQIPAQTLLEPVTIELPPASAQLLDAQLPMIGHLGFQIETFGRGMFIVRAIPSILTGLEPGAALRVLVEDFEEDETPLAEEIEAKIIARVCKRAAIKAGQALSSDEQEALIRKLETCQSPRTCPHGRPTMIHLSVDLLERQFGRKGAR
ncbi:DNA mismatch repair endonuclease MutL [Chloroflexota bacterium]